MFRKPHLLQITMFAAAASLLLIGFIQWRNGRVLTQFSVVNPADLVVANRGDLHPIPVKLVNEGSTDIQIIGFDGY